MQFNVRRRRWTAFAREQLCDRGAWNFKTPAEAILADLSLVSGLDLRVCIGRIPQMSIKKARRKKDVSVKVMLKDGLRRRTR